MKIEFLAVYLLIPIPVVQETFKVYDVFQVYHIVLQCVQQQDWSILLKGAKKCNQIKSRRIGVTCKCCLKMQ